MEINCRNLLLRYLLDEMTVGESTQFEEQILSDADFNNLMTEAKYDLLDDYAAGKLGAEERGRVERSILNSAGKSQALQFPLALKSLREREERSAKQAARQQRGWPLLFKPAMALACIAVVIASVVYLRKSSRHSPVARQEASKPSTGKLEPTFVLLLGADVTRDASSSRAVQLPANLKSMEVQIVLNSEEPGRAFEVNVQDSKGQAIASMNGMVPEELFPRKILQFSFPVKDLPPGRYRFLVFTPQKHLAGSYAVGLERETRDQPAEK